MYLQVKLKSWMKLKQNTIKKLIIFDFDGVICDSSPECLITASNNIRALGSSAENRTYITSMKIGAT